MYIWLIQRRSKGDPIFGLLLCEKALPLNEKLGGSRDFKASTSWLKNFKSRHSVRKLEVQGECLSSDSNAAERFKRRKKIYLLTTSITLTSQVWIGGLYLASLWYLNKKRLALVSKSIKNEWYLWCVQMQAVSIVYLFSWLANRRNHDVLKMLRIFRCRTSLRPMHGWIFYDWYRNEFIPEVKKFRKKEKKVERWSSYSTMSLPIRIWSF